MNDVNQTVNLPFCGYYKPKDRPVDDELSRVGPDTAGGEYLRRFWHPVMLSQRVADRPLPLRILGEDLILFRDLSGAVGLVHKHCSHRGMSLEFGIVARHGIRCAYHGWCFDTNGQILETPGESPSSLLKQRLFHGAYPVVDSQGLIFAYFGPPELKPPFPRLDMMELPGNEMLAWQIHSPCNWLQVSENSIDPFHTPFLHTRMSGVQFEAVWGELPVVDYHERDLGFFYTNARRSGDNIWVRIHDHLLPNFSQNGALYERGENTRTFGRASLTRWVVPIDDTNCYVIAWRNLNLMDDPEGRSRRDEIGWESVDFYGQSVHRPQVQRQSNPGDWDAWVSQGPITSHQREHLGATDHGVRLLRNALRKGIRNLQLGIEPLRPEAAPGGLIPTFAGDTIVCMPKGSGDDRALILKTSRRVADAYLKFQDLPDSQRRAAIQQDLTALHVG